MQDYTLDFIGIDYAVDNVSAAEEILPLAAERKIGVLVYVPFGRTRLWRGWETARYRSGRASSTPTRGRSSSSSSRRRTPP